MTAHRGDIPEAWAFFWAASSAAFFARKALILACCCWLAVCEAVVSFLAAAVAPVAAVAAELGQLGHLEQLGHFEQLGHCVVPDAALAANLAANNSLSSAGRVSAVYFA